jgi:hypothetical protein
LFNPIIGVCDRRKLNALMTTQLDIILGIRVIHQLRLVFDFQHQTVTWDDIVLPMLKKGTIHQSELAIVNSNKTAPTIVQKALH